MVDLSGNNGIEHGFPNWVFFVAGAFVFTVVGFFGYKLYTSLYEKERKREEKRKMKEMKKKK